MKAILYGIVFIIAAFAIDGKIYQKTPHNRADTAQKTAAIESPSASSNVPSSIWSKIKSATTAEPVAINPDNLPNLPTDEEMRIQAAKNAVIEAAKVKQMMVFIDNRVSVSAAQKIAYAEYDAKIEQLKNEGATND